MNNKKTTVWDTDDMTLAVTYEVQLGENKKETEAKIKSGVYKLADLND